MVIALKRNKLTISEEVKIIQEVEENPSMSWNEIAKHFVLSPLSVTPFWGKLKFLKRKVGVVHILRNEKTFILFSEEDSEPYYWFNKEKSWYNSSCRQGISQI
jgi:hypothetical protein